MGQWRILSDCDNYLFLKNRLQNSLVKFLPRGTSDSFETPCKDHNKLSLVPNVNFRSRGKTSRINPPLVPPRRPIVRMISKQSALADAAVYPGYRHRRWTADGRISLRASTIEWLKAASPRLFRFDRAKLPTEIRVADHLRADFLFLDIAGSLFSPLSPA